MTKTSLQVAVTIIEDYIILGGSEFLSMHASSVANILDLVVGNVNDRGLLSTLPVIDILIQVPIKLASGNYYCRIIGHLYNLGNELHPSNSPKRMHYPLNLLITYWESWKAFGYQLTC